MPFHQAFHVALLLAFLGAVAAGFVGLAAPLLFPDRAGIRVPAIKTSAALIAGAAAALAADWLFHALI